MKQLIANIINQTNFSNNCHGLQAVESAEKIASHYFQMENISYNNWHVREIPLVDNSGKYPVAVVLCVNNKIQRKEIELDLTRDGKIISSLPKW